MGGEQPSAETPDERLATIVSSSVMKATATTMMTRLVESTIESGNGAWQGYCQGT